MIVDDPVYAILLEAVSIQQYIFQSNRLKENLGASFLVETIYGKYLKDAVEKVVEKSIDINSWKTDPSEIRIYSEPFEVGYIGGGNALLLFQQKSIAEEFIKEWTRSLLIHTPGLQTAVALSEFDLGDFKNCRMRLFLQLRRNKAKHIPQTNLLRHGITSECTYSGLSMDVWNHIEKKYVSSSINAKITEEDAKKDVYKRYENEIKDKYGFTDQLDKLGQISGEDSHIAIVHIDGNNIGNRFKAMNSLENIRNLSITVNQATKEAFSDLTSHITDTDNYDNIMNDLGFDDSSVDENRRYPKNKKGKKIRPIRSIILGGDDVTFVCDGKLGIYFSKLFIEAFEKKTVSDKRKLTACAGIAVIKTKYPFYRGYQLAEELCGNAKKIRREQNDSHSYIDFHISTGGLSGTLDEIRKKYFKVTQGTLLFRPYKLVPGNHDEKSFDLLVKNAAELKKFPNNKIKELREKLSLSKNATIQFVKEMSYRGRSFPEIQGRPVYAQSLFDNSKTPYFDMIELMQFYPKSELCVNGGGS